MLNICLLSIQRYSCVNFPLFHTFYDIWNTITFLKFITHPIRPYTIYTKITFFISNCKNFQKFFNTPCNIWQSKCLSWLTFFSRILGKCCQTFWSPIMLLNFFLIFSWICRNFRKNKYTARVFNELYTFLPYRCAFTILSQYSINYNTIM